MKSVLVLILVMLSYSLTGQTLFYENSFTGGVTGGGYSPGAGMEGTGTITLDIEPGSTIVNAFLIAGRHGEADDITVILNGIDCTFDDSNIESSPFESPVYGGPSAVHVIDVTGIVDPAVDIYSLVVPGQSPVSDRYTEFYLYIAYGNADLEVVNAVIYLNSEDFFIPINYPEEALTFTNPVSISCDVGLSFFCGYTCSLVDATDITMNGTFVGTVGGNDLGSGPCGGPVGSFVYQNDILVGLNDDLATPTVSESDALLLAQSYFTETNSFELEFSAANNSNAIWALFLTYGCASIDSVLFDDEIEFCEGESFVLDAGNPGAIYEWQDGSSEQEYVVSESGIYWCDVTIGGESIRDSTTITVNPTPEADFEFVIGVLSSEDGLTGGCVESVVQFNDLSSIADPGEITSWYWDFGGDGTSTDENPTHMFSSTGTYSVTLTVETDNGCSTTYELEIIMTESLTLEMISSNPTCYGFTDGSVTVNVSGGSGDLTFTITDADENVLNEDNSNTANTLGTGWYYINVEDETFCSGADSVFLTQPDEMDMEITTFDPLCNGFETGWARVDEVFNYTGDEENISFFWSPNPSGNEGLGADSAWAMGAGEYTLTINDENGCSKTIDFTISEPEAMTWAEYGTYPAQCRLYGYQNGNGVVFGAATGGTGDFDYHWENDDDPTDFVDDITTWGGKNPGNYTLTAADKNGCVLILNVELDSVSPIADFTVNSDQLNTDCQGTATAQVEFVNNSLYFANSFDPTADTTFFWNLDTPTAGWQISNSYFETFDTAYVPKGQSYFVDVCLVAINKNGCKDTICKELTIYEPFILTDINIFTPNGDGINDVFTFEFKAASISEFTCVIVNRWGVVIDELNSITDGWDGTDRNGDKVKDGLYFYTYRALTDDSTILEGQGNIQVVESK
jgi:gliding motility-associated-like protein